jgi:hypothetical protein
MSRSQGVGTSYYGKKAYNPQDKSYITTEWFVLLLFPIFPIKSLRVIKMGKTESNYIVAHRHIVSYKILQRIPLKENVGQIIKTYLFTYGGLVVFIGSWCLLFISSSFAFVPMILSVALLFLGLVKSE